MKDDFDHFVELFKRCGITLTATQYRRFWDFHLFLQEKNKEIDLTRIRGMEDMVVKHYVDSLMVQKLTALESPVLDIGTGPGFPGIPLKIGDPDLEMILAEGRGHRVEFLKETCRLLGLKGVEVYPHKVSRTFAMPVRTVITRAFEPIGDTLRRVGGFLGEGARVVFMKGPGCADELEAARGEFQEEYRLAEDIPYVLPTTSHERRLVVFERTGELMRSAPEAAGEQEETDAPEKTLGRRAAVKEITSSINDTYKMFQRILSGKGIRKTNMALVSGTKQVSEIVRDFPEKSLGLIVPMNARETGPAMPATMTLYRLHPELFRSIDMFGTGKPILLVRAEAPSPWTDADAPDGCTLFISCQDPDNVGSLIRSAAALGVQRIVLLKEAANPYHPKSIRVAGSALFRIPLFSGPSILDIHSSRLPIIALSPDGEDIAGFRFPPSFGLLPGLEGQGVPQSLRSGRTLAIPMSNRSESLNTAVAAAIALYLWKQQAIAESSKVKA